MDDQKDRLAPVGLLAMNIKNEPNFDNIELEINPWNVQSLQAFLCLKCPECVFDTKEKVSFENHAIENHPLSSVLFGKTVKEEKTFDKEFDLRDPLLADKMDSEDLQWEPDYLDYCESKLEEGPDHSRARFDSSGAFLGYGYTEHNVETNGIKQLKKTSKIGHKKKDGNECPICKEVLETQSSKMEHVSLMHPERKIHDCHYCDFKCLILNTLKKHKARKHPEHCDPKLLPKTSNNSTTRICQVCKEKFSTRIGMMEHYISNHPDTKVYSCQFCGVKQLGGRNLEKHITRKHPEQESYIPHSGKKAGYRMCPICKLSFKSRSLMMEHFPSVHPEEKIYNCSLCDEHYLNVKGLQKHIFRTHERKITSLGCSFCGKDFLSKQDLKNHIDTEHETKEYECSKCDAKFRSQEGLQSHIEYVHEGKRYQCTTCGEVLESITKLESHTAQVHDRTKLFECPTCKAVYTSERTLKEHISFVHENATGHLCPECGESFRDKRQLRDHIFVVHEGKEYKCGFCSKSYGSKLVMQKHVRTIHQGKKPEPAKCSMCDKYFTTKSQVKIHIQAVHEKKRPYACDLCNLSFAQTAHLKTHMKGKHRSAI